MSHKAYLLTAGVVFLLIAIGHLMRIALGAAVVVEGLAIAIWPSVIAVIFMGYLAFEAFRLSRKLKP